ncbi:MAG: AAA family ATPase [Casimicrobiaceae bacterium]
MTGQASTGRNGDEYPPRERALREAADRLAEVRLVILRGLPGSGKTTLARALVEQYGFRLFEADQHFETSAGYRYDPARVADAHAATLRAALLALESGQAVVLANTHVRRWELAGALGLAVLVGVTPHVVECVGQWKNVHGVDEATLEAMARRWETIPMVGIGRLWRWDGHCLRPVEPLAAAPNLSRNP